MCSRVSLPSRHVHSADSLRRAADVDGRRHLSSSNTEYRSRSINSTFYTGRLRLSSGCNHRAWDGLPVDDHDFKLSHCLQSDANSKHFYSAPQCSHCKRCTSYGNFVVHRSVRPSVTRRYSVKTTERRMMQFALSDSKMCLVLYKPKNVPQG